MILSPRLNKKMQKHNKINVIPHSSDRTKYNL